MMKKKGKRKILMALGFALAFQLCGAAPVSAAESALVTGYENGDTSLNMTRIAGYSCGQFNVDGGVMEIVAYNTENQRAYAINGQSGKLAVISLQDLAVQGSPQKLVGEEIDIKALVEAQDADFSYGDMTSVAVSPDQSMLAAALQARDYNDPGRVALFDCQADGSLTFKGLAVTGVQPDMVTFASDALILTADEGEPREGYGEGTVDPKGSVTMVDGESLESQIIGFDAFDSQVQALAEQGVVLKKDTAPSVDLEPEYIAVADGKAYITLQEANSVAVLDLEQAAFEGVYSIGFEDYSQTPIDIDKKDDAYQPKTYESLMGIRMPDAIAAFERDGRTYLVTANEGDGREWGDEDLGSFYLNEAEADYEEEGAASPTGGITAENSGLVGKVTYFDAQDYEGLDPKKDYLFGGRSFTIFEATGKGLEEVFTSGDDFEALTAQYVPDYYNASNDNAVMDDRSGKKGPEPESVTVGTVNGQVYAFVALERTGGIMVYDVTRPDEAAFVNYINTRDFTQTVEGSEVYEEGELDKWVTGGDVAPEGLCFIAGADSPTGQALLLAACEVSGTVAVYQVGGEALQMLPFGDVSAEAWYFEGVSYVYEKDMMRGTSAASFEPDAPLTRAMTAQVLYNMEGTPAVESAGDFTDVSEGQWFADAVNWAAGAGVVSGYGNGLFGSADSVTREQLAVMLYQYAGLKGCDTQQGGMAIREFADYDEISEYALEAMDWAVSSGLFTGTEEGRLLPESAATRAQVAAILMAFDQMEK